MKFVVLLLVSLLICASAPAQYQPTKPQNCESDIAVLDAASRKAGEEGLIILGVFTSLAGDDKFGQYVKPQPSARDITRKVSLRCSPRKLWLGDTLTLNMSVPHGRDLAILSPDDKFFWLRSWEPNDQAITAQWYAFEKVRQLKIVTGKTKGSASNENKLIFTKTGWYSIRISYNLETDDGTPFNECKVYYVHRSRPARVSQADG